MTTVKTGLFCIGLDAYWSQFAYLRERLEDGLALVYKKIPIDSSSL